MTSPESTVPVRSVLVVEDDEEIGYILNFMLSRDGFEVTVAKDGHEAMELIQTPADPDMQGHPDIVLLDINIPYVSGLEILTAIRKKTSWKDVPVIMLTARAQETVVMEAMQNGASDFITKPFLPTEVIARLKKFL